MAIKHHVVTLSPDQYPEWNKFVDESPQGDIFCYSWWLDVITHSNFRIFAAIENEKIVAGMPLAFDSEGKINEPPLTRTLGILYSSQEYSKYREKISKQRKLASTLIEKININDFVQTSTHHNFDDWLPYRWKGLNQTTRYTYILKYRGKTYVDLWNNLESGCRNVINRAEKSKISVEESQDILELYNIVTLAYLRQGIKFKMSFESLKQLDDSIKSNGKRLILNASDQKGCVQAAIYIAYNPKSAYFLLSGADPVYRKSGGQTLLFWEAIKFFRDKVQYCNFGGSDIRKIESYLQCFGGVLTPYFHIYNEHTIDKGIRHHLKELSFHMNGIVRKSAKRFFSSGKHS